MGKKVKKARSGHKDKRAVAASQKPALQLSSPGVETKDDVAPAVKERRKVCPHLDKGFDLVKVSSKIGSSGPLKCEDCREESVDRRAGKAKGKHGKKKGGGSVESKLVVKAVWVCLECGHFSCGGAGFPTTNQSHAVRHASQNGHHLAIQFKNPQLRWCFRCNTLIPLENSEENGQPKDVLSDIVKVIKARPSEDASLDVEDVCFGSGSVTSEIKSENTALSNLGGGGYVVRGLVNLGNTCFFNSISQNLLAMGKLRDHFSEMDGSIGPLTVSLKKLYVETNPENGLRSVINPKSFFGCVCAKAPQFRGYQQHDSHELLRCLLDGLCIEESNAIKQTKSSKEEGTFPNSTTFVDAIFGGKLSSTVSCLECAHSSIVHEPFLDLSLPIPTKKPPSRNGQPVTQPKKPKLLPRRSQRIRSKVNLSSDPVTSHSTTESSTGNQISLQVQCSAPVAEKMMASSVGTTALESIDQTILGDNTVSASQNFSATQGFDNKLLSKIVSEEAVDNTTWLDYLEPDLVSADHELAAQNNGTSVDTTLESIGQTILGDNKVSASQNLSATQGFDNKLLCRNITEEAVDNTAWLDYLEPDAVSGNHELAVQSNATSVTKEINDEDALENDVLLKNALEFSRQDPSHCVEETSLSDDPINTSEIYDISGIQDSVVKDAAPNDDFSRGSSESSNQVIPKDPTLKMDYEGYSWEEEPLLQIQSSEILLLPYKEDSVIKEAAPNDDFSRVSSESCNQVIPKDPTLKMDYEGYFWEEEPLLQIQSSEILLLPYKEDTLTSAETLNGEDRVTLSPVGCEQDSLDFGGFGDLFNEPEDAAGPAMRPSSNNLSESNEVVETGITVGNSSGSDLDEIDDTDSPVSVERCLAYFTKPELLSKNEHAWHCENCSKALVEQMRSRKKLQKSTSIVSLDGCESKIRDDQLKSGKDFPYPINNTNLSNGNNKKDLLDSSADRLVSSNENIDGSQNCTFIGNQKAEQPPVASQLEEEKSQINDSRQKLTCSLDSSNDSCSVNESGSAEYNNVLQRESQFLTGERESEGSEGEADCGSIKVKRDATKRILVDKAPPILTIHLKRFSQDARGRISKLNGHVDFRDTFDLKPYMHPRCIERENYKYRLLGVVEHLGTIRGGHYVAYVRGGPKSKGKGKAEIENHDDSLWYQASDADVREVSFEEVLRCEAYILFYEEI